jgi:VIT1/CCC1 family predicted Fe2+/Mn2+ transporter
LVSSLIVLTPFFFVTLVSDMVVSYVVSMALALVSLFGLGMFLGHISGRSLIGYGIRTAIAGVVAIVITRLLPTN